MKVQEIKSLVESKGFTIKEEEIFRNRAYITSVNEYSAIELGINLEKGIIIRFNVFSLEQENISDVHYSSKIAERMIEKANVNANVLGEAIEAFKLTYSLLNN